MFQQTTLKAFDTTSFVDNDTLVQTTLSFIELAGFFTGGAGGFILAAGGTIASQIFHKAFGQKPLSIEDLASIVSKEVQSVLEAALTKEAISSAFNAIDNVAQWFKSNYEIAWTEGEGETSNPIDEEDFTKQLENYLLVTNPFVLGITQFITKDVKRAVAGFKVFLYGASIHLNLLKVNLLLFTLKGRKAGFVSYDELDQSKMRELMRFNFQYSNHVSWIIDYLNSDIDRRYKSLFDDLWKDRRNRFVLAGSQSRVFSNDNKILSGKNLINDAISSLQTRIYNTIIQEGTEDLRFDAPTERKIAVNAAHQMIPKLHDIDKKIDEELFYGDRKGLLNLMNEWTTLSATLSQTFPDEYERLNSENSLSVFSLVTQLIQATKFKLDKSHLNLLNSPTLNNSANIIFKKFLPQIPFPKPSLDYFIDPGLKEYLKKNFPYNMSPGEVDEEFKNLNNQVSIFSSTVEWLTNYQKSESFVVPTFKKELEIYLDSKGNFVKNLNDLSIAKPSIFPSVHLYFYLYGMALYAILLKINLLWQTVANVNDKKSSKLEFDSAAMKQLQLVIQTCNDKIQNRGDYAPKLSKLDLIILKSEFNQLLNFLQDLAGLPMLKLTNSLNVRSNIRNFNVSNLGVVEYTDADVFLLEKSLNRSLANQWENIVNKVKNNNYDQQTKKVMFNNFLKENQFDCTMDMVVNALKSNKPYLNEKNLRDPEATRFMSDCLGDKNLFEEWINSMELLIKNDNVGNIEDLDKFYTTKGYKTNTLAVAFASQSTFSHDLPSWTGKYAYTMLNESKEVKNGPVLTVNNTRIMLDNTYIIAAKFDQERSILSWSSEDNDSSASIQFFRDINKGTYFLGWINFKDSKNPYKLNGKIEYNGKVDISELQHPNKFRLNFSDYKTAKQETNLSRNSRKLTTLSTGVDSDALTSTYQIIGIVNASVTLSLLLLGTAYGLGVWWRRSYRIRNIKEFWSRTRDNYTNEDREALFNSIDDEDNSFFKILINDHYDSILRINDELKSLNAYDKNGEIGRNLKKERDEILEKINKLQEDNAIKREDLLDKVDEEAEQSSEEGESDTDSNVNAFILTKEHFQAVQTNMDELTAEDLNHYYAIRFMLDLKNRLDMAQEWKNLLNKVSDQSSYKIEDKLGIIDNFLTKYQYKTDAKEVLNIIGEKWWKDYVVASQPTATSDRFVQDILTEKFLLQEYQQAALEANKSLSDEPVTKWLQTKGYNCTSAQVISSFQKMRNHDINFWAGSYQHTSLLSMSASQSVAGPYLLMMGDNGVSIGGRQLVGYQYRNGVLSWDKQPEFHTAENVTEGEITFSQITKANNENDYIGNIFSGYIIDAPNYPGKSDYSGEAFPADPTNNNDHPASKEEAADNINRWIGYAFTAANSLIFLTGVVLSYLAYRRDGKKEALQKILDPDNAIEKNLEVNSLNITKASPPKLRKELFGLYSEAKQWKDLIETGGFSEGEIAKLEAKVADVTKEIEKVEKEFAESNSGNEVVDENMKNIDEEAKRPEFKATVATAQLSKLGAKAVSKKESVPKRSPVADKIAFFTNQTKRVIPVPNKSEEDPSINLLNRNN